MTNRIYNFLGKNLDTVMLLTALAELQIKEISAINADDEILIEAIKRSTNDLSETSSNKEVIEYLQGYDESQISGLVSNIKGVYHELHFSKIENEDGDEITAELFEETNHAGFDIKLTNNHTGAVKEVQLKATNSEDYVDEWLENYGNNTEQILVTNEIASKMGLQSTGISNKEVTVDTQNFIESAMNLDDKTLSDSVPLISLVSISFILVYLFGMYHKGDISKSTFMKYALIFSGKKVGKIILIGAVLSIPIVGQTLGVYLVYKILNEGRALIK